MFQVDYTCHMVTTDLQLGPVSTNAFAAKIINRPHLYIAIASTNVPERNHLNALIVHIKLTIISF